MEPEPQPEPKINTEKIEDVDVQAKIAEQEVNNAEVETDGKAHKDINNQIENIISDIDINIKAQEKITQLKEQELQLIQKQQELANQIQQQQLLAQRLIAQNRLQEQELQQQQMQQQQLPQQQQHQQFLPQQEAAPKLTQEYTKSYSRQEDSYDSKESSNMSRTFDLRKIFTPATDAPQILPKNRKLYASSAFYSPTLHPTVEDQVELARRISHSLSDISNQKSKGQSMYVNRKKRSVKWVHEASGQDYQQYQARPPTSPNLLPAYSDAGKHRVQLNLHQDQLIEKYSKPGVQVVKSPWEAALQTGSASTAFLDGSNYRSQTPTASLASPVNFNQDVIDYHQGLPSASKCSPSPCIEQNLFNKTKFDTPIQACNPQRELAYKPTVAQGWGGRNVELPREYYSQEWETQNIDNINEYVLARNSNDDIQQRLQQLEQFQQCFMQQQRMAALNRDYKNIITIDRGQQSKYINPINIKNTLSNTTTMPAPSKVILTESAADTDDDINEPVNVRELIYSFEQQSLKEQEELRINRWQKRMSEDNCELEKELNQSEGLYVPKEISLSSYAPPPVQSRDQQQRSYNFPGSTNVDYSQSYQNSPTEFPISTPTNPYSSVPPKQQLYGPQSYQKVPPISMQSAPQVNFNPSPLSFDKLAKFQESAPNQLYLNVNNQMSRYGSGVRNASPTPFGSTGNIDHRSTPIKSPQQHFGGYGQNITHSAPLTMSPKVRSAPGQCFNNSARGWSAGSTVPQRNIYCPRVPVVAEGLPYSDF
ncbi:probable basic-leucine zipper transcription factor Q isoform X7 [Drosophila grimshawi]|uniref:probable basic-leucine zipper transcription factor Q isoform X7 n=1 Tax=Drosophila grimshawi TaxID=7222 RepID=UPI001C9334DF|nr:probable basic-leucine zipper transcription factor Q isoform X7 [Drosophila grimshawi]